MGKRNGFAFPSASDGKSVRYFFDWIQQYTLFDIPSVYLLCLNRPIRKADSTCTASG